MNKNTIITGISISQQMKKAKEILKTKVIPQSKLYQKIKGKEK